MSIYITGDTHGEFSRFSKGNFPQQKELTVDDYVIVTGDFGLLWQKNSTYYYWLEILRKKKFTILWIDGNHCNFDLINSLPVAEWNSGKVHFVADNIIHLMRGQVFKISGKTFFTFGGARSIDRGHRIEGVSWWREEEANYSECQEAIDNLAKCGNKVDYVISHGIFPELIVPMFHEYRLKAVPEYSGASEKFLANVYRTVEFKEWYFGHYHCNVDYGKFHCLYNKIIKLF